MIESGRFGDKKILLIDKVKKEANDRTWCFWETTPGLFQNIVYKEWQQLWFHDHHFSSLLAIHPYRYKLIRGKDFYEYCLAVIRQQPNIEIMQAVIEDMYSHGEETWLLADGIKYKASYIFNSLLPSSLPLKESDYYLLQHFKGWVIETKQPFFNEDEATLMDFRVPQLKGATFVYVMPFSSTKALVEYTLFSEELLTQEAYDTGLRNYLSEKLSLPGFTILEEETGVIPMTDYAFPASQHHIINIGTAGGQTKASSGYTFRFIQKHSAAITALLAQGKAPLVRRSRRFDFYDKTLLSVLASQSVPPHTIFTTLFRKNKPQQVLRFLDNESSFTDELKIISSLPAFPFLKAAIS